MGERLGRRARGGDRGIDIRINVGLTVCQMLSFEERDSDFPRMNGVRGRREWAGGNVVGWRGRGEPHNGYSCARVIVGRRGILREMEKLI